MRAVLNDVVRAPVVKFGRTPNSKGEFLCEISGLPIPGGTDWQRHTIQSERAREIFATLKPDASILRMSVECSHAVIWFIEARRG